MCRVGFRFSQLEKERNLIAAKVSLIENAWIDYTRNKREEEKHRKAVQRVEERFQHNERMTRLAASLKVDPLVSEAFSHANADLVVPKKQELQRDFMRWRKQLVAASVGLDEWWVALLKMAVFPRLLLYRGRFTGIETRVLQLNRILQ